MRRVGGTWRAVHEHLLVVRVGECVRGWVWTRVHGIVLWERAGHAWAARAIGLVGRVALLVLLGEGGRGGVHGVGGVHDVVGRRARIRLQWELDGWSGGWLLLLRLGGVLAGVVG